MTQTTSTNVATIKTTNDLVKAVAGLSKIAEGINSAVDTHAETVYQIELADARLAEVIAKTDTAVRESAAEIALRIRENEASVLDTLMASAGFAKISSDDLVTLRTDMQEALESNADAIESAVSKANQSSAISNSAAIATAKAAHEVAMAQKTADNVGLVNQIAFLKEALEAGKVEAAAIRDANVATAVANAPVAANIVSGK